MPPEPVAPCSTTDDPPPAAPAPSARPYLPILDVLRIVSVIGVVGVHVVATPVAEHQVGLPWEVLRMVLALAVPVFLMMSGALTLAPGAHRRGPQEFLSRRAARILPALVVWSAFYMLVVHRWSGEPALSWQDMVGRIVTGETFTHLYFLWAIAGLYLLAPVLAAFLEQPEEPRDQGRRAWVLGISACLWTVTVTVVMIVSDGSFVPVQQSSLTYALLFLGYFVVGRAALAAPVPRRVGAAMLVLCLPLVALMTAVATVPDGEQEWWHRVLMPAYQSPVLMLCSILLFSGVISWCGPWRVGPGAQKVLREAGNATFGVFLVHFAILIALRELVPALAAPTDGAILLLWTLSTLGSFAFALLGQRIPGVRRIL